MQLEAIEMRILGSLMEKARTTPDLYPLTLNSLVAACNQKTSREPVTDFTEDAILGTVDRMREAGWVMRVDLAGSRTARFRENVTRTWALDEREAALLAVLLLRGAQTPGQLRQRTDRMHPFSTVAEVQDCLHRMENREEEPYCLVQPLGRKPGTKEIRYRHTLAPAETEAADAPEYAPLRETAAPASFEERLRDLEERVKALEERTGDRLD